MAAIFGWIANASNPDTALVYARLEQAMQHATPHGWVTFSGPGWKVGRGYAPAENPSSRLQNVPVTAGVCVVDAHLTNRVQVADRLGLTRHSSSPDLVTAAYARWGHAVGDHLEGAWSIAAVAPDSNLVTLIRDPLGSRPLYFALVPTGIAFASDSSALLQVPAVTSNLDLLAFAGTWVEEVSWCEPQATVLRDIKAVPAGSIVCLSHDGGCKTRRYWNLATPPLLDFGREEEAVEAFQEIFSRAVRSQLDECNAPGLMLSGGIDSGAVLAAAQGFGSASASPLRCVSALTDDGAQGLPDEMRNIRTLLASQSNPLTFTVPPVDRCGPVNAADAAEVAWAFPHPTHASALIPGLAFRLARQSGMDVMLDGIDGDLVTSPYADPLAAKIRSGHLCKAFADARAISRVNTYMHKQGPHRIAARSLVRAATPAWASALRQSLSLDQAMAATPLSGGLIASQRLQEHVRAARDSLPKDARERYSILLAHRVSRSIGSFRQIASRWGIDSRHPWADLRVVEFFNQLTLHWRVRDGWTKYLVRRACEPSLSAEVVWHSGKSHAGMALISHVVRDAAPYLRGVVEAQYEALTELIKPTLVDEALAHLRSPDSGGNEDNAMLVASMAGWLAGLAAAPTSASSPPVGWHHREHTDSVLFQGSGTGEHVPNA